jgi:hypothetical protein
MIRWPKKCFLQLSVSNYKRYSATILQTVNKINTDAVVHIDSRKSGYLNFSCCRSSRKPGRKLKIEASCDSALLINNVHRIQKYFSKIRCNITIHDPSTVKIS